MASAKMISKSIKVSECKKITSNKNACLNGCTCHTAPGKKKEANIHIDDSYSPVHTINAVFICCIHPPTKLRFD